MTDNDIRASSANSPIFEFPNPAFTRLRRPLSECRVAVVTTAALRLADQPKWQAGEQSYRVLPDSTDGVILGHLSPSFDRTGFITDPNVVFPIDRLHEMATNGEIGSVASKHIAFLGNIDETMTTVRLDTGPAAAKLLKDDGVDIVVITPV